MHLRYLPALVVSVAILFSAGPALAVSWTGPPYNPPCPTGQNCPPNGNVPAPLNVGSNAQSKNGLLGVNESTVPVFPFEVNGASWLNGSVVLAGSNLYLNFGGGSGGSTGYGLRDNAGSMEYKNSGGSWTSISSGSSQWVNGTGGIIYYNGGNVGIGINPPLQSLDVGPGTTKTSNLELTTSGAYEGFNIYYSGGWKYRGSDYGYVIRHDGGDLGFYAAPTGAAGAVAPMSQYLVLMSDGKVGIGTASPGSLLELYTNASPLLTITRNSNTNFNSMALNFNALNSSSAKKEYAHVEGRIWNNTVGSEQGVLGFFTTNAGVATENMRLYHNGGLSLGAGNVGTTPPSNGFIVQGNVGVGTAAPTSRFMNYYASTVNPSLTWDSFAPVNFRDENSELVMGLSATSPYPYYLQARTSGSTAKDISLNPLGGNVGVGTTSPGSLLSLNGIANFTTATSSLYGNGINLAGGCFAIKGTCIGGGGGGTNYWTLSGTNIYNNNAGNVGIGTPNPTSALDVSGSLHATGGVTFDNGVNLNTATNNYIYFNSDLHFAKNGTGDRIRIDSSGNVGIGTATPGASNKLEVAGGDIYTSNNFTQANAFGLWAKNSAGTLEQWMWPRFSDNVMYTNFASGGWNIRNNSSAPVMFLSSAGNVGIGTVSPAGLLDVNGRAGATSLKVFGNFTDLTNNAPWYGIGTSNLLIAGQPVGAVQVAGYYGLNFQTSAGQMVMDYLGNVGIGKVNPTTSLFVNVGAGAGTGLPTYYGGGGIIVQGSSVAPGIGFAQNGVEIGSIGGVLVAGNWADQSQANDLVIRSTNGGINFATQLSGTCPSCIVSSRMYIDNGGKVGIRRSNPVDSLDVWGAIHTSGSAAAGSRANETYMDYCSGCLGGVGSSRIAAIGPNNATPGRFQIAVYSIDGSIHHDVFQITPDGNVGISDYSLPGTPPPAYPLDVTGDIRTSTCLHYNNSSLGTCSSDSILKKHVQPFTVLGLEGILGLRPVTFEYNGLGGNPDDGTSRIGLIAQDVEKVAPTLVGTTYLKLYPGDATTTEIKTVNYSALTFGIINAVQELNAKLAEQQAQIDQLKAEIEKLKASWTGQ